MTRLLARLHLTIVLHRCSDHSRRSDLGLVSGLFVLHRLSHSEAALMDPQSRILLEQTSLALGAAGGQPAADTGVYVGVMHMEYIQHITGRLCPATYTLYAGLLRSALVPG